MFRFFRHRAMSQLQGFYQYPFIFMTACKWVSPMSSAKFESFQQSLENLFNWLENKDVAKGHFIAKNHINEELLSTLKRGLGYQLTPVVIANSLDLLVDIYPTIVQEPAKIGIIHIGRYNWLSMREQKEHLDILNMLKKCHSSLDVLSLGTFNPDSLEDTPNSPLVRGELLTDSAVEEFIQEHEQILISFDVSSMAKNTADGDYQKRDSDIHRFLNMCVKSDKLRTILLVANSDRTLYSRKTKVIYDELKALAGQGMQIQHA